MKTAKGKTEHTSSADGISVAGRETPATITTVHRQASGAAPTKHPVVAPSSVVGVAPDRPPIRRAGSAKGHYILAADFDALLFDAADYA